MFSFFSLSTSVAACPLRLTCALQIFGRNNGLGSCRIRRPGRRPARFLKGGERTVGFNKMSHTHAHTHMYTHTHTHTHTHTLARMHVHTHVHTHTHTHTQNKHTQTHIHSRMNNSLCLRDQERCSDCMIGFTNSRVDVTVTFVFGKCFVF